MIIKCLFYCLKYSSDLLNGACQFCRRYEFDKEGLYEYEEES